MTQHKLEVAKNNNWLGRPLRKQHAFAKGQLTGQAFFAKDLFDVAGHTTTAGCWGFQKHAPAAEDAIVIKQLKTLGAELIGSTNMDPLAYGFVTNNPHYGLALNPHDSSRICGGSSGGAAAVVAAGLSPFSIGTDTSGSIRVPAAFNGVYGFKPSAGMLSTEGTFPLSPSFDRVGLFAKDAETLNRIFTCLCPEWQPQTQQMPDKTPRIASLGGYFRNNIAAEILESYDAFCRRLGIHKELDLPYSEKARAAAYILVAAEAAEVHDSRMKHCPELFDKETRARLAAASLIPTEWITRAHKQQAIYSAHCEYLFKNADILVAPCVPCLAPKIEDLNKTISPTSPPLRASLGQFTQPISLSGLPVVALPVMTKYGLPTAFQIIGKIGSDHALLRFTEALHEQIHNCSSSGK